MTGSQAGGARLILYVGKGGVGKTTMAAITAVRAAELGWRTLVVSTDIAHSLGDVLGCELSDEPRGVAPDLDAQEINVLEEARRHWGKIQSQMAEVLRKEGLPAVQAEELAVIPGMQEIAALVRIYQQARTSSYDVVIVDAAPTGETLRLLTMPDSLEWYASRLSSLKARLNRFAGPLLRNLLPNMDLVDVVSELSDRVRGLRKLLSDADTSSYRIVLTADGTVLKEAQRAETYLNLFGYPIDAVFVNSLLPEIEPAPEYFQQLQKRQQSLLSDIEVAFAGLPLFRAPLSAAEPVGLAALSSLAARCLENRTRVRCCTVVPRSRSFPTKKATWCGYRCPTWRSRGSL
ncbi:MAG: AAA family ATPase [Dehalococcoidia bacterium]|nr:AAA family ATPase [Dehalococcoidia bacterium]